MNVLGPQWTVGWLTVQGRSKEIVGHGHEKCYVYVHII